MSFSRLDHGSNAGILVSVCDPPRNSAPSLVFPELPHAAPGLLATQPLLCDGWWQIPVLTGEKAFELVCFLSFEKRIVLSNALPTRLWTIDDVANVAGKDHPSVHLARTHVCQRLLPRGQSGKAAVRLHGSIWIRQKLALELVHDFKHILDALLLKGLHQALI